MEDHIRTVKELIEDLRKLPPDMKIIYSSDDEGNSYNYVYFEPTRGKFDDERSFISEGDEDYNNYEGEEVVCIN